MGKRELEQYWRSTENLRKELWSSAISWKVEEEDQQDAPHQHRTSRIVVTFDLPTEMMSQFTTLLRSANQRTREKRAGWAVDELRAFKD